jgi:hypothetical protein
MVDPSFRRLSNIGRRDHPDRLKRAIKNMSGIVVSISFSFRDGGFTGEARFPVYARQSHL